MIPFEKAFFCCPICRAVLKREARSLVCGNRHSFDVAAKGYVNLLRAFGASHGDNADMVAARRRFLELTEKWVVTTLEEVKADMARRDANDSTRDVAPAVPAEDAVILDNSDLDREQTVLAALRIVEEKLK